jgi:hypothetical protein
MKPPAGDRLVEALAELQKSRAPNDRFSSERAEIASHIARFRAHQERFRLERDAFYVAARAKLRSALQAGASAR